VSDESRLGQQGMKVKSCSGKAGLQGDVGGEKKSQGFLEATLASAIRFLGGRQITGVIPTIE